MKVSGELRRGTELILMVERDRAVNDLARDMLARYGYSLLSASDKGEAVALYRKYAGEIAIVLIDALADCQGSGDLFHAIREINPCARVIATSRAPQNHCFLDMLRHGVAGYLQKPYRMTDLLNMVGRVLNKQ